MATMTTAQNVPIAGRMMTIAMKKQTHYLLLPLPAYGHIKPLVVLATRMVLERSQVVITLLISPNFIERVHIELSRLLSDEDQKGALSRIRVLCNYLCDETLVGKQFFPYAAAFPSFYNDLIEGKPLTCSVRGVTYDAEAIPTAIIMDLLALPIFQAVKAVTGSSIPILGWVANNASSFLHLCGPESMGGIGNLGAMIDEVAKTGRTVLEIGDEVYRRTKGDILRIPGLPPVYDHEVFPQKPMPRPVSPLIRGAHVFLRECDGVLIATSDAYEKQTLHAIREWFVELKKPLYIVGPLLPLRPTPTEALLLTEGDFEIARFLDRSLAENGDHSVLLIAFGTIEWPSIPEQVATIIEALLKKNFPFIVAYPSPFAKISQELMERVKASGLGILTRWCPQEYVLNHRATGWFLTHGGHGGVTEGLGSGIPLICWPFDVDQPFSVLNAVTNLGVAFELLEVRTHQGLGLILRTGKKPKGTIEAVHEEFLGVIEEMRGEKGKMMRRKAEQLKHEFKKVWQKDGAARKALLDFLDKHCAAPVNTL